MAIRILFLAAAVCALSACHVSVDSDPGDAHLNLTDLSVCQGPTDANVSLFSNTWHTETQNRRVTMDMAYQFSPSDVIVTNTCTGPDGSSVSTSVDVPISTTSNQVMILQSQQNSASFDDGTSQVTCNVSVDAGSFTYGFVGDCLSMVDPDGQATYMTP